MNTSFGTFMAAIPIALSFASVADAQPQAQPDKIPVKLQVVISTFEGDKKISSMPYTLLATANGNQVSFNSSANVPIQGSTAGTVSYTNLGANLQCTVTTEAGSFKVTIQFSDRTVVPSRAPATPGTPAKPLDYPTIHDVSYNSAISMKDGETKQLISAPDKITGEILKIDVTLTLDPPRRAAVELDNRDASSAVASAFSLN